MSEQSAVCQILFLFQTVVYLRMNCLKSVCPFKGKIIFRKTLISGNVTLYDRVNLFFYKVTYFNFVCDYKVMTPHIFRMMNEEINFYLMLR